MVQPLICKTYTPFEELVIDMAGFTNQANVLLKQKDKFIGLNVPERDTLRLVALQAMFAASHMASWLDGVQYE